MTEQSPDREPLRMPFGEKVVMGIFLAMSIGGALVALTFQLPEARDFPLGVSIITALIIIAYFVVMAVPSLSNRLRPYLEDDIFAKINAASEAFDEAEVEEAHEAMHEPAPLDDAVRKRRELALIGFLLALGLGSWLVGLTIAVPVFVASMMISYSKEPVRLAVITGIGTGLFLYLVFNVVLRQPPHFGLLESLL